MNPENNQKHNRTKKVVLLIVALVLVAALFGWWLGQSNESPNSSTNNTNLSTTNNDSSSTDAKLLVSYTLPDGWKEASCPSDAGAVFILPSGVNNVDCNANPSSPVKISVDPANSKDCNQLQNNQNVKKHICISQYINDNKSLKATTEYLTSSTYGKDTTVNAYYIDTGKGVVKVEYVHSSDNQFQTSFDQLANSIKTKN